MQTLASVVESACGKKAKHPNKFTAEMEARRLARETGDPFDAYECRFCGAWHVGHKYIQNTRVSFS